MSRTKKPEPSKTPTEASDILAAPPTLEGGGSTRGAELTMTSKTTVTNRILGNVTIRIEEEAFNALPRDLQDELHLYMLGVRRDGLAVSFDVRHWLAPGLIGRIQEAVGFKILDEEQAT